MGYTDGFGDNSCSRSVVKAMIWEQQEIGFWPFWFGIIDLKNYPLDELTEMYDWLIETCPNQFKISIEWRDDPDLQIAWRAVINKDDLKYVFRKRALIYFRKESDATLFKMTWG